VNSVAKYLMLWLVFRFGGKDILLLFHAYAAVYSGSVTLLNFSAASSGQIVFTNNPDPSSNPEGMVVLGQISMCQ